MDRGACESDQCLRGGRSPHELLRGQSWVVVFIPKRSSFYDSRNNLNLRGVLYAVRNNVTPCFSQSVFEVLFGLFLVMAPIQVMSRGLKHCCALGLRWDPRPGRDHRAPILMKGTDSGSRTVGLFRDPSPPRPGEHVTTSRSRPAPLSGSLASWLVLEEAGCYVSNSNTTQLCSVSSGGCSGGRAAAGGTWGQGSFEAVL